MDLFVAICLSFFFRIISRAIKFRGCRHWTVQNGTVTNTGVDGGGVGCAIGWITYTYRVADEPFTGMDKKPFISADSAEEYSRFARDSMVVLRVKPSAPEISTIRDEDQVGSVATSLREASERPHT